ncbi:hypothetical protein CYLTODRAFT_477720, partial [Cylindrobasidium torrendii FP15055 ss-10]
MSSITPQVLLPLVADLAPPERCASAISTVFAGLLLGVLIARVIAGIITDCVTWRVVYYFANHRPRRDVPLDPGLSYKRTEERNALRRNSLFDGQVRRNGAHSYPGMLDQHRVECYVLQLLDNPHIPAWRGTVQLFDVR